MLERGLRFLSNSGAVDFYPFLDQLKESFWHVVGLGFGFLLCRLRLLFGFLHSRQILFEFVGERKVGVLLREPDLFACSHAELDRLPPPVREIEPPCPRSEERRVGKECM